MATTRPAWKLGVTPVQLAEEFAHLAAAWKRKAGHWSDSRRMAMVPEYQRIIGMGPAALPLILEALEREPDHWFWALEAITGEDPVPPGDRGVVARMADAWLAWGREQGLIR